MKNKIIQGDCIEKMKELEDNSVDAIVTDPPYGLEFMGKEWDKFKHGNTITNPQGSFEHKKGFKQMVRLAKDYETMMKMQDFFLQFGKEALRVLKPGGFLLAFGGTRTYHRLACGIEDAGFEIRDCIQWLYGSGFPKSLNIGKAIEGQVLHNNSNTTEFRKIKGETARIVNGYTKMENEQGNKPRNYNDRNGESVIKPEFETEEAKEWEGWGTALKPANEPIVVARKPLSEKNVALNVLKWGTGGINIDGCRIGLKDGDEKKGGFGNAPIGFGGGDGKGVEWKKDTQGRFPANIIFECTCEELKEGKDKSYESASQGDGKEGLFNLGSRSPKMKDSKCQIHTDPNCPCRMLDEQSGLVGNGHWAKTKVTGFGEFGNGKSEYFGVGEKDKIKAGASRFFYCAKASKSERNFGCDDLEEGRKKVAVIQTKGIANDGEWKDGKQLSGVMKNNHPTVKPIKLMEYLIKLVSPEGATILDPFLGSGTTGIAAAKLNRNFIGIEKEPEYIKIAEARIKPFLQQERLF